MANVNKIFVQTGLGRMSLREYLELRAHDSGYRSGYTEAYKNGFRVKGYEDIVPEDLHT